MESKKDKDFSLCKSLYSDYIVCLFVNAFEGGYNYVHCNTQCKKYKDCISKTK